MRDRLLLHAAIAQCDRSAGLLNFFPSNRADFIDFDLQAVFYLAVAQDLYARKMAAHELRFAQQLLVYHCAGFELIKIIKIHDRILLVKGSVVKSALWQSPNQRHLPAFEPEPNAPAGARFLPLMTFAARLSVP